MKTFQPWHQYPLISKQLKKVNQCIMDTIQTSYADLQNALLAMADNGGKYLRPSMLILAGKASMPEKETSTTIIQLASSIEVLHMATLIHDDIIDDSDRRRGKISIQARFGKDIAVYAGDLLFTHFFDLMLKATDNHQYLVKNAQTMHAVLNGELGQMDERFNMKQTFNDYLADVKGKTAALFKLAAEEGAFFSGASADRISALASFGENIGIAFQIIDDILDYTGGTKLNKPVLEDLVTGVYSLPLLVALQDEAANEKLVPLLAKKREMTKDDIKAVQTIILNSSAIDKSRQLAKKYTDQAIAALMTLPESSARTILIKMTDQLLTRRI
ncbi:polyprenyl synthetase family protein [Lactobacillus xujianguonis]|uniref:Polyprenyl synthetase family protein n=1 Tax=Lactobacillus xujianguonis TaxID=2495899 RepID=A0A437SVG6_9LACO|nr:polyprenyl synthetase family protein [Lactobacillus xujianguonis]RVU70914.1 polyprenyl synthetase family protein [Lactobacillus xujianguonis]RVU73740.1 polyprenyl synthetase family protein [Lactobacillus xujianguonis]